MSYNSEQAQRPRQKTVGPSNVMESENKAYLQPNPKYTKSEAGISQYAKLKLPYPDSYLDALYQKFLDRNPTEDNPYASENKTIILGLTRVRTQTGKQYLAWNELETRHDGFANKETFARTEIGTYPIIQKRTVLRESSSGIRKKVEEPTGTTTIGYWFEFNKDNMEKLHKNCVDNYVYTQDDTGADTTIRPTGYAVNDLRTSTVITVQSYKDLLEGDFDELVQYGKHIKSEKEGQQIRKQISQQKKRLEKQKFDKVLESA